MVADPFSLALGGGQLAAGLYGAIQSKRAAKKARRKQKKIISQVTQNYTDLARRYTPSGAYGKRLFKGLETQKALDVGAGVQQALRSGLGGTTYADVANRYEATTGRESRLRLEDYLFEKQASIEKEKNAFLSGINVTGPSSSDISSSVSSAIQGLGTLAGAFTNKETPTETSTAEPTVPSYLLNSEPQARTFLKKRLNKLPQYFELPMFGK